jgi:ABC-type Zn uptake system ZnuABC Zn-binding protein ZnuA
MASDMRDVCYQLTSVMERSGQELVDAGIQSGDENEKTWIDIAVWSIEAELALAELFLNHGIYTANLDEFEAKKSASARAIGTITNTPSRMAKYMVRLQAYLEKARQIEEIVRRDDELRGFSPQTEVS